LLNHYLETWSTSFYSGFWPTHSFVSSLIVINRVPGFDRCTSKRPFSKLMLYLDSTSSGSNKNLSVAYFSEGSSRFWFSSIGIYN
jgi:hypothetical protein